MLFTTRDCLLFPNKLSPLVYGDTRGLSLVMRLCDYMQLVTPSEVAIAVRIDMTI